MGAGVAGLGCARELARAGADVLVVGEQLGGRIRTSRAGANLGASYVTTDYVEMGRFSARGARIWMKDVAFLDTDGRWHTVYHLRNLRRAGQLARLYSDVLACRRLLNQLRSQVRAGVDQRDALGALPHLRALVERPAGVAVIEGRYQEVAEIFAEPILHSTLFVTLAETNAFYLLASLFPIVLPVWAGDFTRTLAHLADPIRRVLPWRVLAIASTAAGYRLECDLGVIGAGAVVLATPPGAVPSLPLGVVEEATPPARRVPITSLHLRGRRRAGLPPGQTIFFRPGNVVTVLWRQPDGTDIAFSHDEDPDLSAIYDEVHLLDSVRWAPAIVLSGSDWRPRQLGPRLYGVGDYNLCGLEDSFVSGASLGRLLAKDALSAVAPNS